MNKNTCTCTSLTWPVTDTGWLDTCFGLLSWTSPLSEHYSGINQLSLNLKTKDILCNIFCDLSSYNNYRSQMIYRVLTLSSEASISSFFSYNMYWFYKCSYRVFILGVFRTLGFFLNSRYLILNAAWLS